MIKGNLFLSKKTKKQMSASVKAGRIPAMQSEGLWSAPAAGDNADDDALFNGPEVRKLPPNGPLPPPGALQAQIAKVAAMLGVMHLLYQGSLLSIPSNKCHFEQIFVACRTSKLFS